PTEVGDRAQVIEWLMFQMASVGPMFGQLGHFRNAAPEQLPYAIERYRKETLRLLGVLDRQLATKDYIAGTYSIADIATFPWVEAATTPYLAVELAEFLQVQAWAARLAARPAVKTGMAILTPEFESDLATV
ncbi:MAG: glutathione binding-like protein, partial [Cyanobacteria bacterium P01_A01_bin.135]